MIYVITAVHNRYVITEKFVEQLLNQTYSDIKLILVDDGCTDGTSEMVLKKMPNAVIIKGNGNLWWGGALHEAYKWIKKNADKDAYCMFANDDTEFENDYISKAIDLLNSREKTLLTGCGISRQSGKIVDGAVDFDTLNTAVKSSNIGNGNCASTRSLFFRVQDFLTIGGFHPILLPHYGSDYEWTIRAHRKYGYSILCDAKVKYLADETTTGDNHYDKMNRKKVFSKRSVSNPIYKFSFIVLTNSFFRLFKAILNQIRKYFRKRKTIIQIIKK